MSEDLDPASFFPPIYETQLTLRSGFQMKILVIGGYRVACSTNCYSQLWFKSSFQCLFVEHEKIILFVIPIPCYTFLRYCYCTIARFLSFICEYQIFHDVTEFITYKYSRYCLLKQLLSNQSG